MADLVLPAPLWRRLVALMYDGLLYLALLMAGLVLVLPFVSFFVAKDAQTPLHNYAILQSYGFAIGLIYFGWSWTRGGQTLGMRVWKLQVRRADGSGLRWPVATIRLAAALAPLVITLWAGKHLAPPPAGGAALLRYAVLAGGAALLGYLPCLLSRRGRAFCDWVAGTEVIIKP